MPRHPIPAPLISRFAVDAGGQRQGLGRQLLRDALVRVVKVADDVGVRALHVHAKNPQARAFYERFGFAQSPVDDAHLQLPIKTIRASLGATRHD